MTEEDDADRVWRAAEDAVVSGDAAALDRLLHDHGPQLRTGRVTSSWSGGLAPDYSPADARTIITTEHCFSSWNEFVAFTDAVADTTSGLAQFETAVDAVVAGNISVLEVLLRANPELVRARSARTHRATLLHYVGANGVEGFRQRTPANAASVVQLLLDAGADVNATADMYGGADTLGLVATSIHPFNAGIQDNLMELLLGRGANVATASGGASSAGVVNACLANGRPDAAHFLARRGAPVDLEAAAGLGQLDLVKRFFDKDTLVTEATARQSTDGFSWACEYGRTDVVAYLLEKGIDVSAKLRPHGQTGLHWAAFGGHAPTVRLLLDHRASVDLRDDRFNATPLGWSMYAWSGGREYWAGDDYHEVVEQLIAAGARLDPESLTQNGHASPLAAKIDKDVRMRAIVGGRPDKWLS